MELDLARTRLPLRGFLFLGLGRRLPGRTAGSSAASPSGLSAAAACVVACYSSSRASGGSYTTASGSGSAGLGLLPPRLLRRRPLRRDDPRRHGRGLPHPPVFDRASWRDEEGYSRFFAYMNLFVGSMLILVMADNLLLLYLGWEGVGLCSFLLIGFWYKDPANGRPARKAFIVTRIGDVSLAPRDLPDRRAPGQRSASRGIAPAQRRPGPGRLDLAVAGRPASSAGPSENRPSFPCRPGSPTRWPAPRR